MSADDLRHHEGYYRDSSPRNALLRGVQFLRDGRAVRLEGDHLVLTPDFGPRVPLVAVNPGVFRREGDLDATLAFTTDGEGVPVLTGPGIYAERSARWPVTAVRGALLVAAVMIVLAPIVAAGRWLRLRRRGDRTSSFTGLGVVWLAGAVALAGGTAVMGGAGPAELGGVTPRSATLYAATLAYPVLTAIAVVGTLWGLRRPPRRWYAAFAVMVALAHAGVTAYLAWFGWLAFRSWTY